MRVTEKRIEALRDRIDQLDAEEGSEMWSLLANASAAMDLILRELKYTRVSNRNEAALKKLRLERCCYERKLEKAAR